MSETPDPITPDDLVAAGLYDSKAENAQDRLATLRYLLELGATVDELREVVTELPGYATVLILRPGPPTLTVDELASRAGMSVGELGRLWRAAGFVDPEPGARVSSEADVEVFQLVRAAELLFGEDAVVQLTRVIGAAMAKVADAVVSAFLVNVEAPLREQDPTELGLAKANAAATSLLPQVVRSMDVLLRRHIISARRSLELSEDDFIGYEVQRLVVGFIDLVGSTALSGELSIRELGAALGEFESLAADIVTSGGGRIVKLIGDEVMFAAPDPRAAGKIALEMRDALAAHPVLPPVRAGLALGNVLLRDGDYYGTVVNLAARAAKVGDPGDVVVSTDLAAELGEVGSPYRLDSLGARALHGFDEAVELFRLGRAGSA